MTEAGPPGAPRVWVVGLVHDEDHAQELDRIRLIYTWALRARDIAHPPDAPPAALAAPPARAEA